MTDYKYIIANIKIPIELYPDGTTVALQDRIHVEFENSNELPSIQDEYNKVIMQKLSSFIKQSNVEKESAVPITITPNTNQELGLFFITKEELHNKKRNNSLNNSLKNKNKKMSKQITYKNRL